jgi:hypothetical protein
VKTALTLAEPTATGLTAPANVRWQEGPASRGELGRNEVGRGTEGHGIEHARVGDAGERSGRSERVLGHVASMRRMKG